MNLRFNTFEVNMDNLSNCTLLIVDDTEANIDILVESLGDDYELSVAMDGESALEIVNEDKPDLVLLDIMMPGMDGYEVCSALKANPDTNEIPIIFLTAATNIESKTKGFELGAVDYITKPFEIQEVKSRVKTHLSLRLAKEKLEHQHHELKNSYDALQAAENARDSLMHMIVHDMRTPLTGIKGSLDVYLMLKGGGLDEKEQKLISSAQSSSSKLIEMVSSLLDLNKLEAGEMKLVKDEHDLIQTTVEAVNLVGELANKVNIEYSQTEGAIKGIYDHEIIRRVITNLLSNSIKFSPNGGKIIFSFENGNGPLRFSIQDEGGGIPEELHGKIFEKFGQAEMKKEHRGYSTGIGLAFCKMAIDAHEGEIGVESEMGKGSKFYFTIPETQG
jgi:two-component system, sensor histidine kinase and response regulator